MLSSLARAVRGFGAALGAGRTSIAGTLTPHDPGYSTANRYRHPRLNRRGEVLPIRFPSPTKRGGNRATRRAVGSLRFCHNGALIPGWPDVVEGSHYHATKGERGGC